MLKFLLKISLLSMPFLALLVATNYFVDPAKRFDSTYEEKIVEILQDSSYVTNISNYDERTVVKKFAESTTDEFDVLVLGSSRTMLINQAHFKNQKLFNGSVSSSTIEDMIINFQIFKEQNKLPSKKIILGIDPWTFNENNRELRWLSNKEYYDRFFNPSASTPTASTKFFSTISELLSLSYFQQSVKYLMKRKSPPGAPKKTDQKLNISSTRLNDNSLVYSEEFRNVTEQIIHQRAQKYIDDGMYMIDDFYNVSEKLADQFEKLIETIEQNEIEVELFLTPYNPDVYPYIKAKYPAVLESEKYINEYAALNDITIHGSFDPDKIKFDSSLFYDGMHCNEEGIQLLLSK